MMRIQVKSVILRVLAGIWLTTFGLGSSVANAMTMLKQVQVSGGGQVDLLFDGKIAKGQIQTEFFNDIIQLSMVDITVYPAKISSVNNGVLSKVFAYQYAPRLVRCRLTVNGKAEDFKDRLVLSTSGKVLTIRLADPSGSGAGRADAIRVSASAPVRPESNAQQSIQKQPDLPKERDQEKKSEEPSRGASSKGDLGSDEKALLQRVITAPVQNPSPQNQAVQEEVKAKNTQPKSLRSQKSFLGMRSVLMRLGFVIAIFASFALLLRTLMGGRPDRKSRGKIGGVPEREVALALQKKGFSGILGTFGQMARSGLGKFAQKEKMIEVLSTHHLGPKQSIAVVRVCGKKMVLGIANDSISLISQLAESQSGESTIEDEMALHSASEERQSQPSRGSGATAAGPAFFSEMLNAEQSKPAVAASAFGASAYGRPVGPSQPRVDQANDAGVRARIRSRLEGMKPL